MTKFTPAQAEAIACNAQEILVSAAAGSGKTAVLTERIVRHVSEGVALSDLLVVTFTKAAAAEMRERIETKLNDNGLSHHAALLPASDISTIDAFCAKLVRENFQKLDIDPAFRVGDDAELSLVKSLVIDEIFEAEYLEGNADFLDLADVYGGKTSDERLESLVIKLCNFLDSDPFPAAAARRAAAAFENIDDLAATPWARIAREELAAETDEALAAIDRAIELCNIPDGPEKYADRLYADAEMLENFRENPSPEKLIWGALPRITVKDGVDPELKERAQRIRNKAVKERMNKVVQSIFVASPEKMLADLHALAPRVDALMRLARRFSEAYAAEKRARNIVDFSDLEHFVVQILYPNGPEDMTPAPPDKIYHEVLIDEYQDSNELQDLILSAVASRRFMVGDVKQSIYRFRRADPGMFIKKYDSTTTHKIDLSHNFRSRPEVIDAVNFIFSRLMRRGFGGTDYDEKAALYPGRENYDDMPDLKMQIELFQNDSDDDTASTIVAETRVIAACIHELAARGYKHGDIAILTRSFSSIAGEVVEELKNHGIDAIADMNEGFFEQQEIKTALAFLRIADNPRQDIDLITVLTSPVYALDADELLEISRIEGRDFYDKARARARQTRNEHREHMSAAEHSLEAVTGFESEAGEHESAAEHSLEAVTGFEGGHREHMPAAEHSLEAMTDLGGESDGDSASESESALSAKLSRFFFDLENFRNAAVYMPVSRLIGFIFDTTNYPAHVANMPGGATRQANLRLLSERATDFESLSLHGLFHFVRYIERLIDAGGLSAAAAEPVQVENAVRLMSIHKSKGLEFPVVICAFLAKRFNTEDERLPMILHSSLGVGPYYIDTLLRTRANTLARTALSRLTRRENLSEELRCLYVAATRAEERLILTGRATATSEARWLDSLSALSYLDWIMPCVLNDDDGKFFEVRWHRGRVSEPAKNFNAEISQGEISDESFEEGSGETFSKVSPEKPSSERPSSSLLPSKLSISEIRRLYDITPDSSFREEPPPIFDAPEFIRGARGVTAARLGSIMHVVVEHIDFERHAGREGVDLLVRELVAKNFLDEEEAAAVERNKIEAFVSSPLGNRMKAAAKAGTLYREVPFVFALGAEKLYGDAGAGENILVHGIIDCWFEEEGRVVVADFKNDLIPKGVPLEQWAERHRTQLEIYREALGKATERTVSEVLLYSFARRSAVRLF